jgi:GntR family transcriptional repressor for pyruvate dehydrogenase complex
VIVRRKLRDQVVELLLDTIREQRLVPGDFLPSERELASRLGVSRTVVREALTALEMQGMLSLVPGRKPELTQRYERAIGDTLRLAAQADVEGIVKLFEVRRMIEPEAAALAAERHTRRDLSAMEDAVERMRSKAFEREGYVQADVAFHDALLVASRNDLLVSMFRPIAELSERSRDLTAWTRRKPFRAAEEHQAILDRVGDRDAEGARQAMDQHMQSTALDLAAARATGGEDAQRKRR